VGFTAAYPALPVVDHQGGGQRLVARTEVAECAVGLAPGPDAAARIRKEVTAAGWTVSLERTLPSGAIALEATNGTLTTLFRIIPDAPRMFVLTSTMQRGATFDAAAFLDSFQPRGTVEQRAVHFAPGHFSVIVPAPANETEDTTAEPVIRGIAGLVDGVQFGASSADAPAGASDPMEILEHGITASLASLRAHAVETKRDPFRGHPSIRVVLKGDNGVLGIRRVVYAGGRLVDVSVYAPSGDKPVWADAYVDSVDVDP
jgi:hypothetical protein